MWSIKKHFDTNCNQTNIGFLLLTNFTDTYTFYFVCYATNVYTRFAQNITINKAMNIMYLHVFLLLHIEKKGIKGKVGTQNLFCVIYNAIAKSYFAYECIFKELVHINVCFHNFFVLIIFFIIFIFLRSIWSKLAFMRL